MNAQDLEATRTETIADNIWSSVYTKRTETPIPYRRDRVREVQKQVGTMSNFGECVQRNLRPRLAFEIGVNPI